MPRKQISTRTRFEIFKRDGFKCAYCGKTPPGVILHVDHVTPVSLGGTSERTNLITSCADCNLGKSDVPLTRIPPTIPGATDDERERFKQLQSYNKWLSEKRSVVNGWIVHVSRHWITLDGDNPDKWSIGENRERAVRTFLDRLPAEKIIEALDIAYSRKKHCNPRDRDKYFCGICWHMIKGDK